MYTVNDTNKLAKYHNAILYFAKNCKPGTTGKVKMAKLLYYMDFDHFEKYLESISGAEYFNRELGPVSDDYWHQLNVLEKEGQIQIVSIKTKHPNDKELIQPLKAPDLSVFTNDEIDTINSVIKKWYEASGTDLAKASHNETPWAITKRDEHVPYALAFHRTEEAFFNDN